MSLDRRQFLLRTGAAGAFGALFAPSAHAEALMPLVGDGRLVVLRLDGGLDALNMFVPYGLQSYYDLRPRIAMRPPGTSGERVALDLDRDRRIGLSPYCPELQREWQAGRLAIVNKVGLPVLNMSHFDARETIATGRATISQQEPRGWIGRLRDAYLGGDLGVVSLGSGAPRELDTFGTPAVRLNVLNDLTFGGDGVARADSEWRKTFMRGLLGASAAPTPLESHARSAGTRAIDLADRVRDAIAAYPAAGAAYPNSELARRLQDIARLLHSNLGARVVYTATGGYDTHNDQYGREAALFSGLSQALGAFCDDLRRLGLFERTTILVMSEFGRRNVESDSRGTDHGYGGSWFLLGGAVRGGLYGGAWADADLRQRNLPVQLDYRALLAEVISGGLSLDPRPLFPNYTVPTARLGLYA